MQDARKRILLIGHNGQIGTDLKLLLRDKACVIRAGRKDADFLIDLEDAYSVKSCIEQSKPELIINAAAYTAVDLAEKEVEKSNLVNTTAPGVMAELAESLSLPLIHYSTDYVFNGETNRPYRETDQSSPINQYGASKLGGELAVLNHCKSAVVLRTSWVYGQHGNNFLLTMLRLAREREVLSIVSDQQGVPSCSQYIALMTCRMIDQIGLELPAWKRYSGLYHLCPAGATTWYDFTREIIKLARRYEEFIVKDIKPITSSEYPTVANRPAYSVLDGGKFQNTFGLTLKPWEQVLDDCMSLLYK